MKNWTFKRRASFWIHALIVIVPFLFSTISAWLFWNGLFQNGVIASAMIVVVDALALTGLILYITRIASPFQVLRHALPFVSIVPLGIELYGVLTPNGQALAVTVALLATAIMVTVAALCFRTIEELFIPPLEAAREKAEHDVAHLLLTMEQLRVVDEAVGVFRGVSESPRALTGSSDDSDESYSTIDPFARKPIPGVVYLLRAELGYKIGRTKDLAIRMRAFSTMFPFAIQLIHTIKTNDTHRLEQGLHEVYGRVGRRIHGEWFNLSQQDVEFLLSIDEEIFEDSIDHTIAGAAAVAVSMPPQIPVAETLTKTEQVKRLAAERGISVSTAWRRVQSGEEKLDNN